MKRKSLYLSIDPYNRPEESTQPFNPDRPFPHGPHLLVFFAHHRSIPRRRCNDAPVARRNLAAHILTSGSCPGNFYRRIFQPCLKVAVTGREH